jgi:hypothetical protein
LRLLVVRNAGKSMILGFLRVTMGFPKPDLKELGLLVSPRYEVAMGELATFWDRKVAGYGKGRKILGCFISYWQTQLVFFLHFSIQLRKSQD